MLSARDLGLTVKGSSGAEELVKCPFHHDNSPSAWFNPRKGLFYCSVCHLGLNIQQLAVKLNIHLELVEAETITEPKGYDLFSDQLRLDLGETIYHSYFQQRNISEEAVNAFGVRWSATRDAAVMPVTNIAGTVKGVTYRFRKGKLRYKKIGETSPLWPMHHLPAIALKRLTVIVEGPFSAMRIATVLPEVQALCLFGARATWKVVEAARPLCSVFIYDRDAAGREACLRLRSMAPSIPAYTTEISPDDMTDQEIENLVSKIEVRTGKTR